MAGAARLIDAGNRAFVTAMHWAAVASVIVAVIGVAVAFAWLPARSTPYPAVRPEPIETRGEQLELAEA